MERARVEHKGSLYTVGRLEHNGHAVTHPLALTRDEYDALIDVRPNLSKAKNPDAIRLVCGCCGSELESGFGSGKFAFVHANPDDRTNCPTILAQYEKCAEYLTEKSFDVLHVKANQEVFNDAEVRLENEKRLAALMMPLTHEEILLPKHRERLARFDDKLSALVGANVYPGLVQVYEVLLFGSYRPEGSRYAREYRGIGSQNFTLFEDDIARQVAAPEKLRLYFSRGQNAVKVDGRPVEIDITESFLMRGYSPNKEPVDYTGLKSRSGLPRFNTIQTRLMT